MPRAEVPGKCLLETSNADARSPKRPKRMAEYRSHENRPVDGSEKNTGVRRWERALNRVFLQPR